jgi:predicted AAA+ superfamily ATPase
LLKQKEKLSNIPELIRKIKAMEAKYKLYFKDFNYNE